MDPIRVGHVRYLNAWPLVEGLDSLAGLTRVPLPPAELADALITDRVDVALVSSADLVRSPKPLAVLGAGMIGSSGPVKTVRLFSKVPLDQIQTIHADTESHTSVALCRTMVARATGSPPHIDPFDASASAGDDRASEDWPEALLLIGDKVITNPPPSGVYTQDADLGALWTQATGTPMVYAVWACLAERAREAWVPAAEALLSRQRLHNATRLSLIARAHAHDHGWETALAQQYYNDHVRYDLDAAARAGLRTFLDACADLKILPSHANLTWTRSPAQMT